MSERDWALVTDFEQINRLMEKYDNESISKVQLL